jgi:predicted Fe-Mo cluster-binding NifX family protein
MRNFRKIAIPVVNDKLTMHFGRCEKFAIFNAENDHIVTIDLIDPPNHEPGAYPFFLIQQGVSVIISGGIGLKARELFSRHNIEVYLGAPSESPRILVEKYLHNKLQNGQNLCDHNTKLKQCSE